jgi:predicted amidohydrolase
MFRRQLKLPMLSAHENLVMKTCSLLLGLIVAGLCLEPASLFSAATNTIRVAAAQPKRRSIDWHVHDPAAVLKQVEQTLSELEGLLNSAAEQGCRVIVFPEDTLDLGLWEAGNQEHLRAVLPKAVEKMLSRFAAAAARHKMYIACSSHNLEPNGVLRNTAFFLSPTGKEIGRYDKVCLPIHERNCKPGERFPVFTTPDLGGVGMLICYDMVFPEPARCLALGGADIIFHLTLGGAAIGDDDISRAAFRTRAVENFVYLVISQRGNGSMIISPQGKILAEARGPDSLALADIDAFSGREGGDAFNTQADMRARLFRERNPKAFGILTEREPPVLAKVPLSITVDEATKLSSRVLTVGEEEFKGARLLASQGKTNEAIQAFLRLRREYPDSWIDRESARRLADLRPRAATQ